MYARRTASKLSALLRVPPSQDSPVVSSPLDVLLPPPPPARAKSDLKELVSLIRYSEWIDDDSLPLGERLVNTLERKERTEWTPMSLGVTGKGDYVRKLEDGTFDIRLTLFSPTLPLDVHVPGVQWVPQHTIHAEGFEMVTRESGLQVVRGNLSPEQIPLVIQFRWSA